MPILLDSEKLLSFPELARALPRRRQGRPVHVSTIHRWRKPGVNGVRLEAIRIGGAWHTSWEAFQRFCERLSGVQEGANPTVAAEDKDPARDDHRAELDAERW